MSDALPVRQDMKPFRDLVPFAEARATALELARRASGEETVAVVDAVGRVAASAVRAPADVPSTARAAMDGYAVIASEVAEASVDTPVALRRAGRSLAGNLDALTLQPGECIEVATGAPLPEGSDAVVPVERTRAAEAAVLFEAAVGAGDHVSARGEDLRAGDIVVEAGDLVRPGTAGVLASVGTASMAVVRRPCVLLIPTGDELVPLGRDLQPGQVYDSNSVALAALLGSTAAVERAAIVGDTATALAESLQDPSWDLVVTLGGTSVGRHDLVVDVVSNLGEVLVHGVALKPGKPVLLARIEGRPVVGLPGFPTSCLMTGYIFVEPMVRVMAGLEPDFRRRTTAELSEPVDSPAGKLQFLTVKLEGDRMLPAYRASSALTSVSAADGWIEIAAESTRVEAGTRFEVTLF